MPLAVLIWKQIVEDLQWVRWRTAYCSRSRMCCWCGGLNARATLIGMDALVVTAHQSAPPAVASRAHVFHEALGPLALPSASTPWIYHALTLPHHTRTHKPTAGWITVLLHADGSMHPSSLFFASTAPATNFRGQMQIRTFSRFIACSTEMVTINFTTISQASGHTLRKRPAP